MLPVEFIRHKREGLAHQPRHLKEFVTAYTQGQIAEENMAAWLMAAFLNGLSTEETTALTEVMLHSGKRFEWPGFAYPRADKHSTGGVGDKTSLILAPIVAANEVAVPMISGRGLGHTGGTVDKLESIPGFQMQLPLEKASELLQKNFCVLIAQTPEICPADRKIYALRDTTATVESIPLITASIMSKKLAEGLSALVFDVKFGSGAFMRELKNAKALALSLLNVARQSGLKATALLTSMNQPLGAFCGNTLEVHECLEILKNVKNPDWEDTRQLSLELAAHMLLQSGRSTSLQTARVLAEQTLQSGRAYEKFLQVVRAQGGDLSKVPQAPHQHVWASKRSGFVGSIETFEIGYALVELKAGRRLKADPVDPAAGIQIHKKIGDSVAAGEPICTLFSSDNSLFPVAITRLEKAFSIVDFEVSKDILFNEVL